MLTLFIVALFSGIIIWRIDKMAEALARLQTEVAESTAVVASAIALIEGLSQQIRDNANDPAALNALADQLDDSSGKLAAAVATNTTAADSEEIPAEDLEPIAEEGAAEAGAGGDTTGTGGQPTGEGGTT